MSDTPAWNALFDLGPDIANERLDVEIRADGQVVQVQFDRMMVEVVPAFHMQGDAVIICNTRRRRSALK